MVFTIPWRTPVTLRAAPTLDCGAGEPCTPSSEGALWEAPVAIPSRVHYAAAATAGESVLTFTDRQLPRGIPVPEQPAAIEMWNLWRALSEPTLGGNVHV